MFARAGRSLVSRSNVARFVCSNQTRGCVTRVNPTSEYFITEPDRPRYSLKRFNLQLSQSVFCRTPNLERTQVVYRVMNHDGVKGDHITFFILFSAIKEHAVYELLQGTYNDMKKNGVEVDHDIYKVLSEIRDQSDHDVANQIIAEIEANGYKDSPPEKEYPSFFFEPIAESATFTRAATFCFVLVCSHMEKIVVIVHVPWKRPAHLLPEFWTSDRDQKLWYFVHKATKSNKPIDWTFIASALGCTVAQCVERSQVMYNNKIEQLQRHLDGTKEKLFSTSFKPKAISNGEEEPKRSLSNEETNMLRKLVDQYEFNWKLIADEWLLGIYDPITCREIYHSLPAEEIDPLSDSDISLSQLDSALFSSN